jgi:serine phosphatase RsbU (regulator of sigma subunit)
MFWRSKKGKPVDGGGDRASRTPIAPGEEFSGDETGTRFLTGDTEVDRRTVEMLLETIARISQSPDLESLLDYIVDNSVQFSGAERGFLILVDREGQPRVRVARTRDGKKVEDNVRFSTSIVRKVLDQQKPVLATVQSDSDALELGRSVFDLKLRAVMCVPLATRQDIEGGTRGVLYVDSKAATREFNQRDLSLFDALSRQIAIKLENENLHLASLEKARLEQSLELASAIQNSLMVQAPTNVPGLEVHGWFRSAERASGDFYEFMFTRDKRLAVAIGDVSGHGVGPALITSAAQASLRSYLRVMPDPAAALSMVNEDLSQRMDSGMFLTLLLLVFGPEGRFVEFINAGHHAPLLARGDAVTASEKHGLALNVAADLPYQIDERLELQSGDVLLAFTDGLIEAHSFSDREQLFGEERVKQILLEHVRKRSDAATISRAIAEAAFQFAGGKHEDDITLVVIRKL